MNTTYVIGLDIGTGSVKAVAVDGAGKWLKSVQEFYPKSGGTEQAIETVWACFQKAVRDLVMAMQLPPAAVCLSSAMHSILAVNNKGEPLTNAILWSDQRSTAIAQALRQSSLGEELYRVTGTPVHSMSPLCKIRWWKDNDFPLFTNTHKFISIKEAIWHRLFGEFVVDYSLASATGMFNYQQLQWEEVALHFAGITAEKLSVPVPLTYTCQSLSEEIAGQLGLPVHTLFIAGGSDGCLANLGSLCLLPSEAAITIGTSAAVRITNEKPVKDTAKMIFSYLLTESTFVCGGAINNGGNVFQWLLTKLFSQHKTIKTYEDLFATIATVPAGSGGLLFLPYLHGERAPIWDEESCGVYFGLTAKHNLLHMARGAAEGVCFALLQILSSLETQLGPVDRLHISGGLVHVDIMMQMLADVTGKQVVVQQAEDASAMGAAYLALKKLGWIEHYSDLPLVEGREYSPQASSVQLYRRLFAVYNNLYPAVKDSMHSLHLFHP